MKRRRPAFVPVGIVHWCEAHKWYGTDERCPECHPRPIKEMEHSRGPDPDTVAGKAYVEAFDKTMGGDGKGSVPKPQPAESYREIADPYKGS